mgnify:CR=1 FL=1
MDPLTASALITGGATLIGGFMGNKAAKQDRAAAAEANRMRMMPYMDARGYVTDMYSQGQDALNSALDAGYYQGPTFAGLNPLQNQGIQSIAGVGGRAAQDANQFMDAGRGFGSNYLDIYNRASQNPLDNAINYATANTEPLLRAAMRDDYRNLTETTLPGINRAASGSMNTNSSRAGIADAVAQRAYDDRQADVAANIQDKLISRAMTANQNQLANMTTANQNLAGTYGTGFSNAGTAADYMTNAGGMLRQEQQGMYDDQRANFDGNRDFAMNQLSAYNAGILGRAPMSTGNIQTNSANPMMAGLSGAMAGFGFGQKYGPGFAQMFNQPTGGYSYGAGNPGSFEQGTYKGGFGGNNLY